MAEQRRCLEAGLLSLALLFVLLLLAPAVAHAEEPAWKIVPLANTTAAPAGTTNIYVELGNDSEVGIDAAENPVTFTATLPSGLKATGLEPLGQPIGTETPTAWSCAKTTFPAAKVTCTDSTDYFHTHYQSNGRVVLRIGVAISASVSTGAVKTISAEVSGGGAASRSQVAAIQISASPPPFGLAVADGLTAAGGGQAASPAGASHPFFSGVSFELNSHTDPVDLSGDLSPVEPLRDAFAELPPGLAGATTATEACTLDQLTNSEGELVSEPLCPPGSQVGVATVLAHGNEALAYSLGLFPVFRMVSPMGVPARFGFDVYGTVVILDAKVRSASDYGITMVGRQISEGLAVLGSSITFWGNPADPVHEPERGCPGKELPRVGGPTCPAGIEETAFLRNPTSCQGPEALRTTLHVDSWQHPAALTPDGEPDLADPLWKSASFLAHEPPGYPRPSSEWGEPVEMEHCDEVPFEPTISLQPTTKRADSPTGLDVDLTMPQGCWQPGETAAICQADLRDATLILPQGTSVNPSSAAGQGACGTEEIGLTTPIGQAPVHFDSQPQSCPDSAKIGSVEVQTPLLDHTLKGAVYLAKQSENPFGSLLALYLAIEDAESGTTIKLAGRVSADPQSGRLETVFAGNPQLPFAHLDLDLFGGPRAALRTPPNCGVFTAHGVFAPWSGNPAVSSDGAFAITEGPDGSPCPGGGFDPKLSAGAQNPLAGKTSPFSLRLTRDDGSQEFGGLTATMPPGLSGYLKGIPYCPDSALAGVSGDLGTGVGQEHSPGCPVASQVGTVTVGAGSGPNPFYTSSGRAYLAGPYKGAPLSLAVIAPAVAGPFDLGSVVVRNAIHIDPESGQLTVVSDPLPHILHGIPLDLRDIRVEVSRPNFTLNPTSCEPFQVGSTITSTAGKSASPSVNFQVAGCEDLAFRPKLGLRLFGKTNRGAHPKLRAVLAFPKAGGANLAKASVALPHSEFLDQAHIRTICTRVKFAADACPAGSIYGYAKATSPIVDYPVQGPVYLRSSNHKLPDMVLALHGPDYQPVEVDAVGRIDSIHGGIRASFESTPDLPLTEVTLTMKGGKKGLIQNSRNICAHEYRATARLDGQNGKLHDFRPLLRDSKCAKHRKHARHAHGHRGGRR